MTLILAKTLMRNLCVKREIIPYYGNETKGIDTHSLVIMVQIAVVDQLRRHCDVMEKMHFDT